MPLYWWHSEAMKNYRSGTVCAEASSPELARRIIMSYAKLQFELKLDMAVFADIGPQWPWDEDTKREYQEFKQKLAKDLSSAPRVTRVVFIPGSD